MFCEPIIFMLHCNYSFMFTVDAIDYFDEHKKGRDW